MKEMNLFRNGATIAVKQVNRMKKIILLAGLTVLMSSAALNAQNVWNTGYPTATDITVTRTGASPNYTFTVSGTGAMQDYPLSSPPWATSTNRDETKTLIIEEGITHIGTGTFVWFNGITSVNVPNSVITIGSNSFAGSRGIQTVTFGSSVTSIGEIAFSGCTGLTSVTLGKSVNAIGANAFGNCTALTAIHVDADNTVYTSDDGVLLNKAKTSLIQCPAGKTGSYAIPEGVTSIPDEVFSQCRINSVTIPESVLSIGANAFRNCTGLSSISIPNSVLSIGDGAFWSCTGLISATIGNQITTIGNGTFMYCSALQSVDIGSAVTSIGNGAFEYCTALSAINVDPANANYSSDNGVLFNRAQTTLIKCPPAKTGSYIIPATVTALTANAFYKCSGLTSVTIPGSISSIADEAFRECSGLQSLVIPNSVTAIGVSAFMDCSGLTSITIPTSVISIGDAAFRGCSGLLSITVPYSVTSIGSDAFRNCSGLTSFYCDLPRPPATGTTVFVGINNACILYVPAGSTASYAAADQWKDSFAEIRVMPVTVFNIGHPTPTDVTATITGTAPDYTLTVSGTGAMQDFALPANVPWISIREDIKTAVINDGVTTIGNCAFHSSKINSVTIIGNTVKTIGMAAFAGCSALSSITIPGSVTLIAESAFGLSGLSSVTIPASVNSIGDFAFECFNLTSIFSENPDPTAITLGAKVFNNVTKPNCTLYVPAASTGAYKAADQWKDFNNVRIMSGTGWNIGKPTATDVTAIITGAAPDYTLTISGTGEMQDYGYPNYAPWNDERSNIKTVIMNEGITNIGNNAFNGCKDFTSITVPATVISIGNATFYDCNGLSSVTVPNSVESIGNLAFAWCRGLTSVTIPAAVTAIGDEAFFNCEALSSITCQNPDPDKITLGATVFYGVNTSTCTLYVPTASTTAYGEADQWKEFITITGESLFVPVTDITGVPATATKGIPLTLAGTVVPGDATNQTVSWSINNAGSTGASISGGNTLNTTAAGTVVIMATINDGAAVGTDYTKSFTVTVNAATDIGASTVEHTGTLSYTGALQTPAAADFKVSLDNGSTFLTPTTDYTVSGSGTNAGTYNATITGAGGYSGTATAPFTIAKSKVTVADGTYAVVKEYDGTTSAGTATGALAFSGLYGGTTVTAGAPGAYPDANAGTGYAVSIALTLSETANHEFDAGAGTYTFTGATIAPKPYGAATVAVEVPVEGKVGATATLPVLPEGAYGTPITVGGGAPALIVGGSPTVSGNTLTFDATAQAANTSATITVPVTGVTNYSGLTGITVTVTSKSAPQEPTPTASIDFVNEQLTGLTASAAYTVNGASKTADATGNIALEAGWINSTVSIVKVGTGGNSNSTAQSLVISARPAAPAGVAATGTTGGLANGTITGVTAAMEYRPGTAATWTTVGGTSVTGLAAGTYQVRTKATSSAFASAAVTVTVAGSTTPPPPDTTPNISGPASMTLPAGYAATSTGAYTITGTSPVTVTKTSGSDRITWNGTTKTLDIAAGLAAGEYPVVLKASNSAGSHSFTFTLTVSESVYYIDNPEVFAGGTVESNPRYLAEAGQTVTLTVTPDAGYLLESLTVTDNTNAQVNVALTGTGATRTFRMPAHHVSIAAVFSVATGNDELTIDNGQLTIKAYVNNGMLHVSGLKAGETWSVYNITGKLVYTGVAPDVGADLRVCPLPSRGVYIVISGNETVKVIY